MRVTVLRAKGIRAIGNRDIVIWAMGDSGHRNLGHRISGSRIRDFGVLPKITVQYTKNCQTGETGVAITPGWGSRMKLQPTLGKMGRGKPTIDMTGKDWSTHMPKNRRPKERRNEGAHLLIVS